MVEQINLEAHTDTHDSLFNQILLVGIEVHPRVELVKTMHRGPGRKGTEGVVKGKNATHCHSLKRNR